MYSQQQNNQQQGANQVSSKELLYLTDCLKNEELLAKLAAEGVSVAQTPQLKQQFAQIAQDRLNYTNQLITTLQQQTQITH